MYDTFSETLKMSCGGMCYSLIGPLLFIIFINDLLQIKKNIKIELFIALSKTLLY